MPDIAGRTTSGNHEYPETATILLSYPQKELELLPLRAVAAPPAFVTVVHTTHPIEMVCIRKGFHGSHPRCSLSDPTVFILNNHGPGAAVSRTHRIGFPMTATDERL